MFSICFGLHGRDIYHAHPDFRSHSTRCTMFSISSMRNGTFPLPWSMNHQQISNCNLDSLRNPMLIGVTRGLNTMFYQREELGLTRQPEIKKANLNYTLKGEKVVFLWNYWEVEFSSEWLLLPKEARNHTDSDYGSSFTFFVALDNDSLACSCSQIW